MRKTKKQKKLAKAIRRLRKECRYHKTCEKCPFKTEHSEMSACMMGNYSPSNWKESWAGGNGHGDD